MATTIILQLLLLYFSGLSARVLHNGNSFGYESNNGVDRYSCSYHDGIITENGISRQATQEEKERMEQYAQQLEEYNAQMSRQMVNNMNQMFSRVFSQGFPFQTSEVPQDMVEHENSSNLKPMPISPSFCHGLQ